MVRAQSLAALIQTGSIGDKAAITLTERLLREDLFLTIPAKQSIRSQYSDSSELYRLMQGDNYLLDALVQRMPKALPELLDHYFMLDSSNVRNKQMSKIFWADLFRKAVCLYTDSELQILNDEKFVALHADALKKIMPHGSSCLVNRRLKLLDPLKERESEPRN
jgi:hypothetical protein